MRIILALLLSSVLVACAGKVDYIRPSANAAAGANAKTIERAREAVWNAAVPELGKQFFVINNLDKSSGLINISYSGDPERYIDCGRITSYVKNARGERTYDFPASKAQQSYEIMNPGVGLFALDRRMNLEGRVNLIFEEVGPSTTRVTANTRYVVARSQVVSNTQGASRTFNDTISFNSGAGASFPSDSDGRSAECVSTGALEREVLSAIR
ncbi:MAG: hypothetical protein ACK5NY_08750 [Burkholderiaceae bacterium]